MRGKIYFCKKEKSTIIVYYYLLLLLLASELFPRQLDEHLLE